MRRSVWKSIIIRIYEDERRMWESVEKEIVRRYGDVTKGIKREILHAVAESVTGKCTSGREADTDEVEGGTGELCGEDTAGSCTGDRRTHIRHDRGEMRRDSGTSSEEDRGSGVGERLRADGAVPRDTDADTHGEEYTGEEGESRGEIR